MLGLEAAFADEFALGLQLDTAGNALKEKAQLFGPVGATGYGAMLLATLASRP